MSIMEKKKKILIAAGAAAGAVAAVYFGFAAYFSGHFFYGSTVNGIASSGASVSEVKKALQKHADGYSLTLTEADGKEEKITSKAAGVSLALDDGQVEALLSGQNAFAWPTGVAEKKAYESRKICVIDDRKLKQTVSSLNCITNPSPVKTEDATCEYANGSFSVKDEVYGTEVDEKDLYAAVSDAVLNFKESIDLEKDKLYVQPKVKSDSEDLKTLVEDLNEKLSMKISYTTGDVIDKDTLAGMFSADGTKAVVNAEAVNAYVKSLARKYNTAGQPKSLKTSYGATVTVPGGNYGWKVDEEKEAAQLTADLEKGEDVDRDIIWSRTANSHDGNDYGNSYIEVNITAQHLFLYVNGARVLDTPVVTGNPSKGNGTHVGAYGITYCEKDAVLRGDNYESHVGYWMPFHGNEGLHDAPWRSSFGGAIYKTNGSHGCVNLPPAVAPKIFAAVKSNFPVLVYELPGTESYDTSGSKNVIAMIKAIGPVTLQSEPAITAARKKYDSLDSASKKAVTNYKTLTDAEAALAALKAQANTAPAAPTTPATPETAPTQ